MNKLIISLLMLVGFSLDTLQANTFENKTKDLAVVKIRVFTQPPALKGLSTIRLLADVGTTHTFDGNVKDIEATVIRAEDDGEAFVTSSHGGSGSWVLTGPISKMNYSITKK